MFRVVNFPPFGLELRLLTLNIELVGDSVKMDHHAKYLDQRSFSSIVIVQRDSRHTQPTNCSTWATKCSVEVAVETSAVKGQSAVVVHLR